MNIELNEEEVNKIYVLLNTLPISHIAPVDQINKIFQAAKERSINKIDVREDKESDIIKPEYKD